MAKAKKTTDTTPEAAAPAPKKAAPKKTDTAAPKAAASKKPAAKPATAGGFGFGIDTNHAAASAARMLLNRSNKPAEQGTIRYVKETLANQSNSSVTDFLSSTAPTNSRSSNLNQSHQSNKNPTRQSNTSADVARLGVPRRTPG